MSNIGGKIREPLEFTKFVGLFEGRVIVINPSIEEYKELLGIELKEDSKATEYLGESKEGNTYVRVDVWLEQVKPVKEGETPERFKVNFFLEDKIRTNKDDTKQQYINNVGSCSWADDKANLPDWFIERPFREAHVGEEELFNFLRTWLGRLDYRDAETSLTLNWKALMKGKVDEIKEQIGGDFCTNVVALATIRTVEKEGAVTDYQNVYNRSFLPAYTLKHFRAIDFSDPEVVAKLAAKKPKDRKPFERFVLEVTDSEYGCKDFYILKDLKEYDPAENIVANDSVMTQGDAKY